jgi:hypothetical protein
LEGIPVSADCVAVAELRGTEPGTPVTTWVTIVEAEAVANSGGNHGKLVAVDTEGFAERVVTSAPYGAVSFLVVSGKPVVGNSDVGGAPPVVDVLVEVVGKPVFNGGVSPVVVVTFVVVGSGYPIVG